MTDKHCELLIKTICGCFSEFYEAGIVTPRFAEFQAEMLEELYPPRGDE